MNEIEKYGVFKEKLQGICDENNLTFSIQNRKYPFFMTVKPIGGLDGQMSMLEAVDTGDTGYISPEAIIVFAYKDGDLTYKMAETINISDSLFNKIKNLFRKMHGLYMMYFFRDRHECPTAHADSPTVAAGEEKHADPVEVDDNAFADSLGEAEASGEVLDGDDSEDDDDTEDGDGGIEVFAAY